MPTSYTNTDQTQKQVQTKIATDVFVFLAIDVNSILLGDCRSQPWSQGGGGDGEGYVDFDLLRHITNNHSLQRCHMNLPKCRSIAKS